jgi:alpha-beta hydrolase superfamily lysophospholipase
MATTNGVQHGWETFAGAADVKLFGQSWRPEATTPPRATVVIMHGLKDHSSRYAEFAEWLVARGFAVYAFDLRGHGNSDGNRVWVDRFEQYVQDLSGFIQRVREREPGRPLFLFGHSMGGAIVTLYTLTEKPDLRGLILSGPALKVTGDVSPFLIGATRFLSVLAPGLGVLDLPNPKFSRDPKVVRSMDEDPLIFQKKGPARTAAELLGAIAKIQAGMESISVPLLALHGTRDQLTNPEGSKELVAKARSADKKLELYDGSFHDLLHEPEGQRVRNDIVSWMEAHLA